MANDILEIEHDLFDENSITEFKTKIHLEEYDSDEDIYSSENFLLQNDFVKGLFTSDIKQPHLKFDEEKVLTKEVELLGSDTVIISAWKNVENISARLIEHYDDTVVLECLIDKEMRIYEEREFLLSLFTGYDLIIGNLFLLRIFERKNEIRIEIHNGSGLTMEDDFPKLDFVKEFSNSRLFKKNNIGDGKL
ncbi:MAG: hypothetical protein K8R58_12775 [Bacteroidales bacterium]|nr:hypothetical protein [Bacteroidales bacterium]